MSVTDQTNASDASELRDQLDALRADFSSRLESVTEELAQTQAQVVSLRSQLAQRPRQQNVPAVAPEPGEPKPPDSGPSRRDLLKKGGVGAAAAVAGLAALSKTAAAADGDPVLAGQAVNSQSETLINASAIPFGNVFTASDGGGGSFYPAALGGYGYGDAVDNGVYAYSNSRSDTNTATGHALVAWADIAARSHMWMVADKDDPRDDAYAHRPGEFRHPDGASLGNLWFCTGSGTPGTWRKLAGPATSGSMHAIAPKRVYDSRYDLGAISNGASRVVSVADGWALGSSAIDQVDLVPDGATAVTFNLTVVGTSSTGYLSVTPGDAVGFSAASINWKGTGSVLNNGTMSTVDSSRQVRVWCSPTGSTEFVIDITGYFL